MQRRDAGRVLAAAVALCWVMATAPGFAAGDAAEGERLARQWCASCHVVTSDQAVGSAAVPSFAEIAADPSLDGARLTTFLADPHPKMPNMNLSNREIADLAAYIETQAGR